MRRFILLAFVLLGACDSNAPVRDIKACPEWSFFYSPGMTTCTNANFDFPARDGVHMVLRPAIGTWKPELGKSVYFQARIIGDGSLVASDSSDKPPINIRMMIQQKGDTLTAADEHKRWWSTQLCAITIPSECRLIITIHGSQWTSVFGKNGSTVPTQFANAINNAGNIGFSFGGMFAAHGTYAIGKVRFELLQHAVMP